MMISNIKEQSLTGKTWYSNEKLKISKQMSKKEIDIFNNEEWIKGRKYGIKNNQKRS